MTTPKVNPIPEGMHTLTPHLVCAGAAEAIAFYRQAFGAVEQWRIPGPVGRLMHALVRIGDSPLPHADAAICCSNWVVSTRPGTSFCMPPR